MRATSKQPLRVIIMEQQERFFGVRRSKERNYTDGFLSLYVPRMRTQNKDNPAHTHSRLQILKEFLLKKSAQDRIYQAIHFQVNNRYVSYSLVIIPSTVVHFYMALSNCFQDFRSLKL